MKYIFLFCICFLSLPLLQGQATVRLLVLDSLTNEPIAFAHVYAQSKKAGAISNEKGYCKFILPSSDKLIVSAIGYIEKKVLANKEQIDTILLNPQTYELGEAIVSDQLERRVDFGANKKERKTNARFCSMGKIGYQVLLEINGIQQTNALRNISYFSAQKIKGESELIRIRIYNAKNGRPHEGILSKSIIAKVDKKKGWKTIDLTNYNITLPTSKFYIGIEFLGARQSDNAEICIGLTRKLSKDNLTWVKTVHGNWTKLNFLNDKKGRQLNLMVNIAVDLYEGAN